MGVAGTLYRVRIPAWLKIAAGVGAAVAGVNWFLRKVWFYRDPLRIPPPDPNLILAPCDGKVVYIRPVSADGTVFAEKLGRPIRITEITRADWEGVAPEGWLIGVYMSPFDVHYNYAPNCRHGSTHCLHACPRQPADGGLVGVCEYGVAAPRG